MPYLAHIALLVRDYDEALAFFIGKLGFALIENTDQPEENKRWVTVRPPGGPGQAANLLLARAATPGQRAVIGNQAPGRVFLFLATDDFDRDHAAFLAAGVRFREAPRSEPYGKVAVFEDLYGNRWDLLEHARSEPSHGRSAMEADTPSPLSTPQTARATIRFGDKFVIESEARATPLGLLAVGGLVAAILLAVPPIVRAKRAARALPPPRS